MRFLKKLFNFLRNKYYLCPVCKGDKYLFATTRKNDLVCNQRFKNCSIDSHGYVHVKCVECEGVGIMFN